MPLLLRSSKGQKLTISELDANFTYLESISGSASIGPTGPQGPTGPTGSYQSVTYSVDVELVYNFDFINALQTSNISYFTQSVLVSYPYTFEGMLSTYSQTSPSTFSQTLMSGFFKLDPTLFPGLDLIGSYKRYDYSTGIEVSELSTTGLVSKYYYIYSGSTGSATASQHTHKYFYDDDLSFQYRALVEVLYDGTFTYSLDTITYSTNTL